MRKLILILAVFAAFGTTIVSCTPESTTNEEVQTDKECNSPPNDRNCNGIPDDEE